VGSRQVGSGRPAGWSLEEQRFGQPAMRGSCGAAIWLACGVEAQQIGDPAGLCLRGLSEQWTCGPAKWGLVGPAGQGLVEWRSGRNMAGLCSGGPEDWTSSGHS
jgi:hypothetical protein